jgi:hypothetical protein
MKWVKLEYEPDDSVGVLENEWNDFDQLTPSTKILHNTYRRTQPWKTGLPIDFTVRIKAKKFPASVVKSVKQWFNLGKPKVYRRHPDPKQEQLFFDLLSECLEQGIVTEEMLQREMASNHIRHDALQLCHRRAA